MAINLKKKERKKTRTIATQKLTLELAQGQKDAVLHFINFNNWNVNVEEEISAEGSSFMHSSFRVRASLGSHVR